MAKIYGLLILVFICACNTYKSPTNEKTFTGISKTCILDSTYITNENVMQFVNTKKFINRDCPNSKSGFDYPLTWPSEIHFNFKTKQYQFFHSPKITSSTNDVKDHSFSAIFKRDYGKFLYDDKKNIIVLMSKKYNWRRSFGIEYSQIDSTITLKKYENYKSK